MAGAGVAGRRSRAARGLCAAVILLDLTFYKGFVEELDESFKDTRKDDSWLVDFYAPWCGHCKKLEPILNEAGLEMQNIGSPVKVGKMDATSYSSLALEFGVRGYPTIKPLKGDLAYNYKGPRTKDDIIEFAHRVSGALVRPLPSQQMFDHVQKRHRGESPLKEKYKDAASELIVYTYFFSASEDVVLEYVTLKEMPVELAFKDETYFVYDEYEDGDLSSWISREGFQNYITMHGFLLYELGDTGKFVAIAVIDEKNTSLEHTRLKSIIQEFGHMDGNFYINTLLMDELTVPTVIILNTSNQQHFLLDRHIKDTSDMVEFINSILDGTVQAQGGDSILQRLRRIAYDAKSTAVSIFRSSPLMGCFLFSLPLGVISIMSNTDGAYIEERYEVSKGEMENGQEQEASSEGSAVPPVQEPKDVLEKKKD
uniref:Protein disulfide-isomerase TMX3 n=1 Tax=Jaculus jaculus TaxID=51337 RepID=A0A8C5L487_JACJA